MPTLLLPKDSVPPCAHRLHLSQLLTRCGEGRWLYPPLLCLLSICRYGVPWRCPRTFLNLHPHPSTYNPVIQLTPDFTSEHRTSSLLCLHLRDRWLKHIQEISAPPSATSTPPRPPPYPSAWGTAPPISCPANLGMSLTPLSQDLPHPTSQEFLVFSLLDGSNVHCPLTVWPLAMLALPEHGGYGLFVPSDLFLGPVSNGYYSRLLKRGLCSGHLCVVPSRDSVAFTVLTNSLLRRVQVCESESSGLSAPFSYPSSFVQLESSQAVWPSQPTFLPCVGPYVLVPCRDASPALTLLSG